MSNAIGISGGGTNFTVLFPCMYLFHPPHLPEISSFCLAYRSLHKMGGMTKIPCLVLAPIGETKI